ncbi:EF hand domain protein [Aspergillus lucknowensis]|uniref:EF hand domain protein n=1 Tax=Aspergillus lucknowensis TaxID=176173 RepID=A0ABR4LHE1_9EURO
MSDPQPRLTFARYRPLLYLFSGVAAAYALVYLRNHLFSSSSQSPIRRQKAVRRRRRNDSEVPGPTDTPSFRAIAHLEQLERHNGVYGTFRIETEDGRRVESGLLPSLLATRDQLMEQVGVPEAHAERMREMMEDTFLESFFALDFPSAHTLEEESPERAYLVEQLRRRGISRSGIERAVERFNADENYGEELRRRRQNGERVTLSTSTFPDESQPVQILDGGETVVDDQSVFSWREGNNDSMQAREGQNLLNLLYHIAEDQARKDGYIHRGVTCNSCGAMPIQGIRYRCANCIDYDLCETCEAMQVHIKTHLFYKVRIPAPFLGNPRQSQPVWYPGKPSMLPRSLPRPLAKRLMKQTGFEGTELEALWDQFRCLANREWSEDPNKLYMAIDRKTFDRCFVPNTSVRPPPPSLIYDRMFAFYDTNNDGLIGFEEFLKGLASLNNKSNDERLHRVFRGYDIDGDGFVERKDFLRVFRAYYTLSRELTRDMVAGMEDDFLEGGARDVVLGSQPISSAFPGSIPAGEPSRTGEGKRVNQDGDMEIVDSDGVLRPDGADTGDRHSVVGEAAVRRQFGRSQPLLPVSVRAGPAGSSAAEASGSRRRRGTRDETDGEGDDHDGDSDNSSANSDRWPPAEHVQTDDIVAALGSYVPLDEITDPDDRARIGAAVYNRMCDSDQRRVESTRRHGIDERWRRRAFYTDEEDGGTPPDGYRTDSDVDEDDEVDAPEPVYESQPPSPRSRSSSKVRFQDDLTDDENCDARSNPSTSSRSILVGERWGGFEVPEVERDVGKEILYQVTQQGFNEILDIMFKPKEDLLMECYRTRAERKIWARDIELVEQMEAGNNNRENLQPSEDHADEVPVLSNYQERPLGELLERAGYSVGSPMLDSAQDGPILAPPSREPRLPVHEDGNSDSEEDDDLRPTHLANPDENDAAEPSTSLLEPQDNLVLSPSPRSHSPSLQVMDEPSLELDPDYDPTLPHHRPNDDAELPFTTNTFTLPSSLRLHPNGTTPTFPAPPSLSPASPEAEATAPKRAPSPIQPLPPPSSSSSPIPKRQGPTAPPPQAILSRWAYLNRVEREAKERGGTGAKLNFEEFSRRMAADRGRRLAFVSGWIEMASF